MKLGAFSMSLAVKDINRSLSFYKKLGFEKIGGDLLQKWLILKNGQTVIGLFEGMFEENILTFNPGWDQSMNPLKDFDDIRKIEKNLLDQDITITRKTQKDDGPDHIILHDPDGNTIMLDQHR